MVHRRLVRSRLVVALVAAAVAVTLVGCATVRTVEKKVPGPTVTATVTATAVPSVTLSTHDAWFACMSATQTQWAGMSGGHVSWPEYDSTVSGKPGSGGTIQMTISFQPDGAQFGDIATCEVGGNPNAPTVSFLGFSDLS